MLAGKACVVDGMTGSGSEDLFPEDLFSKSMYEVQQCVDQAESWRESVNGYTVAEATVHRKYRFSSQVHFWRAWR